MRPCADGCPRMPVASQEIKTHSASKIAAVPAPREQGMIAMKDIDIRDALSRKATSILINIGKMEDKIREMRETYDGLIEILNGGNPLADEVDRLMPEIEIRKNRRGTYSVSFGSAGGLFRGKTREPDTLPSLGLVMKAVAQAAYATAKREAELLQRMEDEEASMIAHEEELARFDLLNAETQRCYRTIDDAFSKFFVADMNRARTITFYIPEDVAAEQAAREGYRMGVLTRHLTKDHSEVVKAIEFVRTSEGVATDPVEKVDVKGSYILGYLCNKYQLDDYRPAVVKAFADSVLEGLRG